MHGKTAKLFLLTGQSSPALAPLLQQALAGLSSGCFSVLDRHNIILRCLDYVLTTGCECHLKLDGRIA